MTYITTKLQPIKSYPTYQFYSKADSRTENLDNVFKICIPETLKWIRSRLKDFSDLPSQIMVSEPEEKVYGLSRFLKLIWVPTSEVKTKDFLLTEEHLTPKFRLLNKLTTLKSE